MKPGRKVHLQKITSCIFPVIAIISIIIIVIFSFQDVRAQEFMPASDLPAKYVPDTRIDNMGYWRRLAELGLVTVQPAKSSPVPIKRSSKLSVAGIATYDSPDIPVTETNSLQSENSVFADPENGLKLLNSNNSHPAPYTGVQYGADALQSADGGLYWDGTVHGVGGYNFGDPATAISRTGRMFVGYIFSGGGQGVSYSDNQGVTWSKRGVAPAPGGFGCMLDKNHLWIDNSDTSPYEGNLYDGWTVICSGSGSGQLQVSRSMDGGLAWQNPVTISTEVAAGSHNQGINIQTGPNGEVYAVWAIYDSWPANEKALGFARSVDGGHTWQPSVRIINNIEGIRTQGVNKQMRVNSFPSMTVDNSNGPDRGSIYVVWANKGEPGINTGTGVDIYMLKSTDQGLSWSAPLKINQDAPDLGKQHFFPWISCDPDNGNLAVVFYDDRNVADDMCETWTAISRNGGISWQDFRVSDVSFTPAPLTGLSDNYFGDYLGITAKNGMVYPFWTDNRTGEAMGYVSPFRVGPLPGQPFIDYYTHLVNDTLTGNGNSRAEYGETFSLSLTMRNIGDQPDSAVSVELSCESPFVQIINKTVTYGDFAVGQMKNISQAFLVRLSDSVPDNSELVFTLSATDQHDSTFLSSLVLRSHAPHLSIGPMFVRDPSGNGNNQPDPGETVILGSVLSNSGDYSVSASVSKLSTTQPYCHILNPEIILDQIAPGNNDTVFWEVSIDASVPRGTLAGFTDSLSYSWQHNQRLFLKKIGVLTEDWETGDMTKMAWNTGGNKPWNINNFMVYEGTYSLRSGYIKNLDTSRLSIVLNLATDDSITFYRKVSSELNFDFLSFYIDNSKVGQWSGEKDWARVSFPVTAGIHTMKWEYTKDLGLSVGYDAAWIDFVEFPVQQLTTAFAGPDARICGGNTFQPDAVATNYQSLVWSTSGTGVFNDPGIFNPVYYPSPADIEAGSVQLLLTLIGFSYGETVTDTLLLTLAPKPTLNAGTDTFTCTGDVFSTSATASNFLSVHWSTLGDGIFGNADTMLTEYIPGPAEIKNGQTLLVLNITPEPVCPQLFDTLLLNIYRGFTASLSGDTSICKGDTAVLKLMLNGQGPWRVYLSDGNTMSLMKPLAIIPVSPEESTIYSIDSISNFQGCGFLSPLSVTVNVKHLPDIKMVGPAESCPGQHVIIQADVDSASSYFWSTGETGKPFIDAAISGNAGENQKFKVQIKANNGCISSDSLLVKIISDCIEKSAGNVDVRYFPNPASDFFTLMLSSASAESVSINIVSMDNKLVYYEENIPVTGVKTIKINLKNLAQGNYMLHIKSGSGEFKDMLIVKK